MAKKTPQKRDGVYQRKDRPGWWISWTDAQDRRRFRKTDAQNITQAKSIRAAELLRVEQAKMLGHEPPGKDTFEQVAARYLKHQKARISPRAYVREEAVLRMYLSRFNSLRLAAIQKSDIQRYVTDRAVETSAYSVRRELSVLKHLFNLAVEEWKILKVSPAQGVKAPKLPAGRVRYLQPTELKALLETCPEGLRQIVALAVSTGMRRGEVMGLRYLDVGIRNRLILLPQTKNGDGRVVQMKFSRICVRLKIANFRFHDLRHTAASWMRMSCADIHTVASLLGHKSLSMAQRYQHLSPAFLSDAVGKLDAVFGDALGLKRGGNGEERYQDVTAQLALTDGTDTSG